MPTPPSPLKLDPRTAFLSNPSQASMHSDVMASPLFHAAASQALLAYQFSLSGAQPNEAVTVAFKLRGAKEFLDVLMSLGEKTLPRQQAESAMLEPPEVDPRNLWKTAEPHP